MPYISDCRITWSKEKQDEKRYCYNDLYGFSLIALCINGVQLTLLAERIVETEKKIKEVRSEMEATCND